MALILIEQPGDYNGWQGNDITNKILGRYNYKTVVHDNIYIFNKRGIALDGGNFWAALVAHVKEDSYVYIHFGGSTGDDELPRIKETVKLCEGSNKIKHLSYYSIGMDEVGDPPGMADIYKKSENGSGFDSAKLIEIFKKKGFVEKKIRQTKEIENQQLHITALLLLLKVNQKSMKAASNLLANLKECLSAMKQGGIDTTNLASYLDSKPLNDLLPESDIKEMEGKCREILQMLEKKKPSLETDKQYAD